MYRADGYRVRTNDAMYELVPYIMPYRYDASNSVTVDIDLDLMQDYIRKCRKKGINMSHMSIIIAGALRIASQNPFLNRFVMNRKIYARNHFCVSFVTLQPGKTSDTVNKLYFNLDDDIFTVNRKVQEAIERTQQPTSQNALDKLMASLVRIPFLVGAAVGVLKFIDKYFTLPFSIINASPFHTSLFITNLASIRTNAIYHHLYDFGNVPVFCSFGKKRRVYELQRDGSVALRKYVDWNLVTDERVVDGFYFASALRYIHALFQDPWQLDQPPEEVRRDQN